MSKTINNSSLALACSGIDLIEERKRKNEEKKDIQKLAEKFISDHSERSFNALMKRCKWGLRSFIYKMTNNDEATDNILSITMEHIYFKIDSFNDDIGKFSTWMYRIAHNDAVTYFRNGGIKSKVNIVNIDISDVHEKIESGERFCFDDAFVSEDIENMYFDGKTFTTYTKDNVISDMYDASAKCVEYLPDHLRIVMEERYINNKKVSKIADDNNIPLSSVKNWIRKGCSELNLEVKNRYDTLYNVFNEIKE